MIDGFTGKVLARRVSITLETTYCIEAVEEAMARSGRLEIFNTDQGPQFTTLDFIKLLKDADVHLRNPRMLLKQTELHHPPIGLARASWRAVSIGRAGQSEVVMAEMAAKTVETHILHNQCAAAEAILVALKQSDIDLCDATAKILNLRHESLSDE